MFVLSAKFLLSTWQKKYHLASMVIYKLLILVVQTVQTADFICTNYFFLSVFSTTIFRVQMHFNDTCTNNKYKGTLAPLLKAIYKLQNSYIYRSIQYTMYIKYSHIVYIKKCMHAYIAILFSVSEKYILQGSWPTMTICNLPIRNRIVQLIAHPKAQLPAYKKHVSLEKNLI